MVRTTFVIRGFIQAWVHHHTLLDHVFVDLTSAHQREPIIIVAPLPKVEVHLSTTYAQLMVLMKQNRYENWDVLR